MIILSAFSSIGRAAGAQPGATKKCTKISTPYWIWGTSGVQALAFSNIEPHEPPRGVDDSKCQLADLPRHHEKTRGRNKGTFENI